MPTPAKATEPVQLFAKKVRQGQGYFSQQASLVKLTNVIEEDMEDDPEEEEDPQGDIGDIFTKEDMPNLTDEIYKFNLKTSTRATKPTGKQMRILRRKSHKQFLKDAKLQKCPRKGCTNDEVFG